MTENSAGAGAAGPPCAGADRPRARDPRTWAIFVRLELMGPIHALAGLADLLAQDSEEKRPDDYRNDVVKLQQSARGLLELAEGLLDLGHEATSAEVEDRLRRARHDLGNRLNQVSGRVQLLQVAEDALFGAFLPDLDRMLELCRECEARLLPQGGPEPTGEPSRSGRLKEDVALVVAELASLGKDPGTDGLTGQVLVADDDPLNRELLRRLLEHEGHRVVEAGDGEEALLLLEEQPFEVLLLDLVMPGLNGFQVLEQLRARDRLNRTSVIVISALHEVRGLSHCLRAGAEDYVNKPVDPMLLRARISSCLLKRRRRAQELERFFPPEIVPGLLHRPDLLRTGRKAEVSILFCDIRGFSRISERLQQAPEVLVGWLNDVMGGLHDCVLRSQGVLADFIGDELLAMWGAPAEQPDHARRACRAALDMLACVGGAGGLSEKWKGVIGAETSVSIGIHSGPASVGNMGTQRRFKYGPVGNTVNLASRIQGATKYLHAGILLTQATRDQLGDGFDLRRLARLQVVNIDQPVAVYELPPAGLPGWDQLKAGYEEALDLFEAGPEHLQEAAMVLGRLVGQFGLSGPNVFLLSRILGGLQDRGAWSDLYVLPGK